MDTASMIREFLDENSIAAARSVEIAYKYHAELEAGCRLTGCEIILRSVGEDVFVRAELPISVMTKETRGVVKYLADLNKKRITEGKQGYFDLDYVAGKIIFGIRVRQPITTALLKEVANYCIDQIEYESDDLLKAVCDECEAVLQEEEEERRQMERENREPSMFALLMRRLNKAIRDRLDPDKARKPGPFGLPGAVPAEEKAPEYYEEEEKPAAASEPAAEKPEEEIPAPAQDEEILTGDAEDLSKADPEFRSLLKTLGLEESGSEDDEADFAGELPLAGEEAADDETVLTGDEDESEDEPVLTGDEDESEDEPVLIGDEDESEDEPILIGDGIPAGDEDNAPEKDDQL